MLEPAASRFISSASRPNGCFPGFSLPQLCRSSIANSGGSSLSARVAGILRVNRPNGPIQYSLAPLMASGGPGRIVTWLTVERVMSAKMEGFIQPGGLDLSERASCRQPPHTGNHEIPVAESRYTYGRIGVLSSRCYWQCRSLATPDGQASDRWAGRGRGSGGHSQLRSALVTGRPPLFARENLGSAIGLAWTFRLRKRKGTCGVATCHLGKGKRKKKEKNTGAGGWLLCLFRDKKRAWLLEGLRSRRRSLPPAPSRFPNGPRHFRSRWLKCPSQTQGVPFAVGTTTYLRKCDDTGGAHPSGDG